MKPFSKEIINTLISGGIGVIPTDTIYGLVGRADLPETVERVYVVRKRRINKPCIVLISSLDDLKKFNIEISENVKTLLETKNIWPGKVSIIFPCPDAQFEYLTRGSKSIAFRIPEEPELRALLTQTGPLVAPSANIEGEAPSLDIENAKLSFGDTVDFYVDGGVLESLASTLIKFEEGKPVVLRQGAVKLV